jgi:hypothetical protein
LGLLLVADIGSSQTTGSIEGRVLDAEGRPLSGVAVTARSSNLQGVRSTSTDGDGRFILPGLPPGDYVVRAELDRSHPAEQSGLKVAIDHGLTVELRMLPSFREEVRVLDTAPIVDVTNTATATVVQPLDVRPIDLRERGVPRTAPGWPAAPSFVELPVGAARQFSFPADRTFAARETVRSRGRSCRRSLHARLPARPDVHP